MTQAPHLLEKSRVGYKYGDVTRQRPPGLRRPARRLHRSGDGRPDRWCQRPRPRTSRTRSRPNHISAPPRHGRTGSSTTRSSRCSSHSAAATRSRSPTTKESARTPPLESLSGLRPAFCHDWHHHRGQCLHDQRRRGAVVVMSKAKAIDLGLNWIAEIGAHGVVAGPDSTLQHQPANAIDAACAHGGHRSDNRLTWWRSTRHSPRSASSRPARWASTRARVNVNGGAIAIGHPLGMSGARIALHLALELKRRGGGTGAPHCAAVAGRALP